MELSHANDKKYQADLQSVENLIKTVEELKIHYDNGIKNKAIDENIDTDEKLRAYQSEFWESHLSCVNSCNEHFVRNSSPDDSCECCKLVWDFCCFVNLYNQNIYGEWDTSELQSRMWTILLAISDIEKCRCVKLDCKEKKACNSENDNDEDNGNSNADDTSESSIKTTDESSTINGI